MMRRGPAVVAALFFWVAGAGAAETARIDACSLLTPQDVSAVIGAKVGAGERNDSGEVEGGGFSSTCVWKVTGSAPASVDPDKPFGGAAFAMLNTIAWPAGSDKARKYLADFYQAAKDNLIDNTPVPVKAGDDALWWGDGVAVRKGDISFGVSAHVGTDKKQERAMEEALARKVAGKL